MDDFDTALIWKNISNACEYIVKNSHTPEAITQSLHNIRMDDRNDPNL